MQNGFCDFVTGPFTDLHGIAGGALINGIGSFNVGSVVTIQQTTLPNAPITVVISSPTSPLSTEATTKTTTLTIINGVNEVFFVNTAIAPPLADEGFFTPVKKRKRVRFF